MSEPITRSEMYLAALGGEAVTPPEPITRMDMYMAYLNGMTDTYPEPITRTEQYLYKLCQNGMGGGGYYQNYAKFKAVFLGDSQTDTTVGEPKKWWRWVEELLNIGECVSYGKSGSTLGDMCSRYASMDADASMVFAMGGVNDLKTTVSTPLGTNADTAPGTIYGSLRYLCQELQKKYPKKTIVFITPTNQNNGFFVHNDGLKSYDIAKAMKEVCQMEGVLCLDAQSSLGINPAIDRSYTSDGLHLNYDGNELLGKWVARQVNNNVPILAGMDSDGSGGGEAEPDEPDIPSNPEVTLSSISVVYSGGTVTAGTDVNDLADIVVTAHYSDGTSEAVTGYTLSGTIAEGDNTITVSYGGKTTTFTVNGYVKPVEIPTEHDGKVVIKYDDLPEDMSTTQQYEGYIGNNGVVTGGLPYYHTGYIACEPGDYNIVPTVAMSEAVYSADFTWKSTTQDKSPHTLSLTEFSYVILNSQPNVYGYATITKAT